MGFILSSPNHIPDGKAVVVSAAPVETKCLFSQVLAKDYNANTFGFEPKVLSMPCIDLDAWEVSRSGNNDRTMDAAVGIVSLNTDTRKRLNHRLLLVELKLGLTGAGFNPRRGKLEEKVKHSRSVLLINHLVDTQDLFIVPSKYLSEAQSKLNRWKRGSGSAALSSWVFLDPPRFNNLISVESDFPYVPKTDVKAIKNDINAAPDSDALCKVIKRWMDIAQDYANRLIMEEARFILENLIRITEDRIKDFDDETEREYIELVLEDVPAGLYAPC